MGKDVQKLKIPKCSDHKDNYLIAFFTSNDLIYDILLRLILR